MEEKLIDQHCVNMLTERIERDDEQERDDETNQTLSRGEAFESALFDKDTAERFLAAINV